MRSLILRSLADSPVKRIYTKDLEAALTEIWGIDGYWQRGGYQSFAELILELVQEGYLKPIKARKTNGMNPPLFNGYQIMGQKQIFTSQEQRLLLTEYHPRLDLTYYLRNREAYQRDKQYLQALDQYFRVAGHIDKSRSVTINERSFQIFRDEKWLGSTQGQALLQGLGLTIDDLDCHYTYEPFFYYQLRPPVIGNNSEPYHILIVENKDSFFSFKNLLQEGVSVWNGQRLDLLIYGEGRKILRSLSFLWELLPESIGNICCQYFGDLDPEGISIWSELVETYEVQGLGIQVATYFYERLWKKHGDRASHLRTAQRWRPQAIGQFLAHFEQPIARGMERLLEAGKYLPQEGLDAATLEELGKEGHSSGLDK